MDPLGMRLHVEMMKQLNESKESYPENHNPNDELVAAQSKRKLANPANWFRRPASNPLTSNQFFPAFDQLPMDIDYDSDYYDGNHFRKFWLLLAEIVDASLTTISCLRNEVKAKDKLGHVFPICFYPDSESLQFNYRSLRQGRTLVLFCPTQHEFLDGRTGMRMEHLESMRVLPMNMVDVQRTAARAFVCSVHKCWRCRSDEQQRRQQQSKQRLFRCSGCGYARYCGRDCQAADYPRHKAECASGGKVLRQIVRLVYFRYDTAVRQQFRDDIYVSHPFDLFV